MGFGSKIRINNTDHSIASSLYGACTDSAGTVGKTVTCADFDTLITGVTIHVKFTYGNTATNPTLNVNGTGAKAIYSNGTTAPGNTKLKSWYDNTIVSFTYDGTAWCMNDVGAGLTSAVTDILNLVYPVGSIYMSVNSTSPATLFGGTWTQIQDTFLLAAGTNHAAASTGGAETVTLATANLPSHNHSVGAHAHGLNSHTHTVPAHAHGLNSHTHTGPSHSHTVNSHTHSIPALSGTAASNGNHSHVSNEWMYGLSNQAMSANFTGITQNSGNHNAGTLHDLRLAGVAAQDHIYATSTAGAHTHSVTTTASTSGGSAPGTSAAGTGNTGGPSTANTANSSALTSGTPSTANTANSSAFNTGNTGSGTAVNKMPPYLAVYVWKRTA